MVKEVKVERTTSNSFNNALKWSDDGQIALVNGQVVNVYSPDAAKAKQEGRPDELYDETRTASIEELQEDVFDGLVLQQDEAFSVGSTTNDYVVTDVCWSPTGMSQTKSCLLGVLTSKNEVLVYESPGLSPSKKWKEDNITARLVKALEIAEPVSDDNIRILRAHSFSWSKACAIESSRWGTSFLALGTASGHVIIWELTSEISTLQGVWKVASQCIVNIEWTDWSPTGDGASTFLAISTSDNAVTARPVSFTRSTRSIHVDDDSVSIFEPSRLAVYSLAWYHDCDRHLLAVPGAGRVQIAVLEHKKVLGRMSFALPFNVASTSALLIYPVPTRSDGVVVSSVSAKGEIESGFVSFKTMSVEAHEAENAVEFILKRSKQREYPNALAVRTVGAAVHKHRRYMVIAYSLLLNNQLRYPIPSELNTRLAFLPLPASQTVLSAPSVTDGSALSTWWEARALSTYLPREERSSFYETIKSSLGGSDVSQAPGSSMEQDLERVMFSDALDVLRFRNHLEGGKLDEEIRRHLGEVITAWAAISVADLTDIDRAIALSYYSLLHKALPPGMTSTPVAIADEFVEATFNFASESDSGSITSTSGHSFARCSVTLLPLTSVHTLTCQGCFKKALNVRHGLPGESNAGLILLRLLDVCVFCGGRFLSR